MKAFFKKNIRFLILAWTMLICVVGACIYDNEVVTASDTYILEVNSGDDITQALKKAINDGYKDITIPAGTYYGGGVYVNDGITIHAAGATIRNNSDRAILVLASAGSAAGVTVEGGIWDGNQVEESPVFGFYGDATDFKIVNLDIRNSAMSGIKVNKADGLIIDNVRINNCGEHGIRITNATAAVEIKDVTISGIKETAFIVAEGTEVKIHNTEITSCTRGIRINGVTEKIILSQNKLSNISDFGVRIWDCTGMITSSDNTVTDCDKSAFFYENCTNAVSFTGDQALRCNDVGIHVKKSGSVTFSGCVIDGNVIGIRLGELSGDALLEDNKVINNSDVGIRISQCEKKVTFSNNTVNKNDKAGIFLDNITGAIKLSKDIITNNISTGIQMNDVAAVEINGVRITNNYSGIRISAANGKLIINGNEITDNNEYGMRICDCTASLTFSSNTVKKNAKTGLSMENCTAGVSIKDDVYEANSDCGITIANSKNITITDVSSNSNYNYGIVLDSASGTNKVTNCSIFKNSYDKKDASGFFIKLSTGVTVTGVNAYENGNHGIYVLDSTAVINQCVSTKNYWCGLSTNGTKTNVKVNSGNFVYNGTRPDRFEGDDELCAGIGVYEGATATLTEVICNYNHGCGITAAGSNDGKKISKIYIYGCEANNNDDHGVGARPYGKINIKASDNGMANTITNNKNTGYIINDHCTSDYVQDCTIIGNGKAGISISLYSTAESITNNIVKENKEDGIHVSENSKAKIGKCVIDNNKQSGVGVYSASSVDITESCEIKGNTNYGICYDNSKAASIVKCTVEGNGQMGFIARNKAVVSEIASSSFSNNGSYGVYCSKNSDVTLNYCRINNNKLDGVRITDSGTKANLKGANINYNGYNGVIVTSGANASVSGTSYIMGNTNCGVYASGNATLSAVFIAGNMLDGVRITGVGGNCKITNGIIIQNKKYGIFVNGGATATVKGTRVIYSSLDGIRVTDSGSKGSFSYINTNGNLGNGISVMSGANVSEFAYSNVIGNTGNGVYASAAANMIITNPYIFRNGIDGIRTSGATVKVSRGTISGNVKYGINANTKANVTADEVSVMQNGMDGIRISDSGTIGSFKGLAVVFNRQNGITVAAGGKISVLDQCGIKYNNQYGVYCTDGIINGRGSSVSANLSDGIRITGSKASATLCYFTAANNKRCGIVVTSGAQLTRIEGCRVIANASHGLAIYKGSRCGTATRNIFLGNKGRQVYVENGAITSMKTI